MPHQRRKSGGYTHGHLSANNSMTDVRRAADSSMTTTKHKHPGLSRKHTPQKLGKVRPERERDWYEAWDDERESFPQYCMTCEKQFMPYDDKFLYCSETCRRMDQTSETQSTPWSRTYSNSNNHYSLYSSEHLEPRDIIPTATPSRPSSLLLGQSPPDTPGAYGQYQYQHNDGYDHRDQERRSSAVLALRSLNTAAPLPSPPSSSGSTSLWPFTRSAATSPTSLHAWPGRGGGGGGGESGGGFFSSTYHAGSMPAPEGRRKSSGSGSATRRAGHTRSRGTELLTSGGGR